MTDNSIDIGKMQNEISQGTKAREALAGIVAGLDGVTPGPWAAFNGCSWWRIGREPSRENPHQNDTAVAYPYINRSDRHPEMGSSEGYHVANFQHIARCDPDTMQTIDTLVSDLDATIAAKDAEIGRLRERQSGDIAAAMATGAFLGTPEPVIEEMEGRIAEQVEQITRLTSDLAGYQRQVATLSTENAQMREVATQALDTIEAVQSYEQPMDPTHENALTMCEHEVFDFDVPAARAALTEQEGK